MPFFSIIIPTYNSEKHVEACLHSILKQNFSDYEVIVEDGLSNDSTVPLIEEIIKKNPGSGIKLRSEKDNGVYDAMNKGIERSSGKWLYFLGSDDKLFDETVLGEMYNVYIQEGDEIIYGKVYNHRAAEVYGHEFTAEHILDQNICHQAIFYSRSVFLKTGNYNTAFKVLADWDHNFKWFLDASIKKKYIDRVIAWYGDNGLSWNTSDELFQSSKADLYYVRAKQFISVPFRTRVLKSLTVTYYHQKKYFKAFKHLLSYFFYRSVTIISGRGRLQL